MKKARILVVEDEELVGLAIRTYLESVSYEVPAVVSSGEGAVRGVRAMEPDLVLMDIHLTGRMDGIEAAGIIKDSYHVPVIYLTSYSDSDTLEKAKLTEPFGYVLKPFDERALEASIEMALHKATLHEELRRAKERLTTVLQSFGEGVIVAGIKGGVEYINATAANLLNLTLPLPLSTSVMSLVKIVKHRGRQEMTLPLNEVILEGNRAGYRNCTLLTESGVRRTVDMNLEPYRDERGMVRGIVLSFRDNTEPRRVEGIVEEELRSAAKVHKSLLPASGTSFDGFSMHGFLLPAAFGAGDVYNWYSIDETHAGLFIVDVMGHGIAAASMAFLVSKLLTPNAARGKTLPFLNTDPLSPRDVVVSMNELFQGFGDGAFFSICYGVIDLKTGRMRLVRAGHPFPVVIRKDGRVEEIRVDGYAVGLSPRLTLTEAELSFAPGDRLFLYSDGLTDCGNLHSEAFTRDRLLALVSATRKHDLAAAVARIRSEVAQWRGSESYDDDITLVGVERAE